MCEYCDFTEDFTGLEIKFADMSRYDDIDNDHTEIYLCEDPNYECPMLIVNNDRIFLKSIIKYCPMCGRKL